MKAFPVNSEYVANQYNKVALKAKWWHVVALFVIDLLCTAYLAADYILHDLQIVGHLLHEVNHLFILATLVIIYHLLSYPFMKMYFDDKPMFGRTFLCMWSILVIPVTCVSLTGYAQPVVDMLVQFIEKIFELLHVDLDVLGSYISIRKKGILRSIVHVVIVVAAYILASPLLRPLSKLGIRGYRPALKGFIAFWVTANIGDASVEFGASPRLGYGVQIVAVCLLCLYAAYPEISWARWNLQTFKRKARKAKKEERAAQKEENYFQKHKDRIIAEKEEEQERWFKILYRERFSELKLIATFSGSTLYDLHKKQYPSCEVPNENTKNALLKIEELQNIIRRKEEE